MLLGFGVLLIASGVALVIDLRRAGTTVGRFGSMWGSLFGNRTALGREKALGRFYGLLMFVVGCEQLPLRFRAFELRGIACAGAHG